MPTIAVPLSDERLAKLQSLAERAGVTADEFLRLRVERLLDRPDEDFVEAAVHVLQKNAELYRRLA